jgi:transcription elongation factor Elf1
MSRNSRKTDTMVESKHDTFILPCPKCGENSPYCINSRFASEVTYGMENAPMFAVGEVNEASKRDTVHCIHCGTSIYLEVCYAVRTRFLSDRQREDFKETHEWRIA